ncbi:MAG: hypothetical protein A3D16_08640 [Rhodobacterales bacterium RIFCSPHIGHO2_02_FULL_62_130]|nr:MAG: hypothetical protein A3D16_08640 [Rhodobacterales bacterium RIFCSPHIGHO2_02_FULL_62_130]OHC60948.1 MAG: hypothetical protein A3E48_14765 [Rhodobacterales bacterium RIFCSPHIGHO2_12_FULL_62_75]
MWVQARNRSTGATETMGLWTGEEDRDFSIEGGTRTYHGAGALLGLDQIVMQTGLTVRMQRVSLAPIAAEVAQMLRGYDAGLAPAEIHRALFDPMSGDLIAEPKRLWKGVIDTAPIHTAEIGGQSTVDVALASAARALTKGLSLTKSDAVQSLRGGDRFRRYQDVTGKVSTVWGEKKAGQ